jgi:hypothetical protein
MIDTQWLVALICMVITALSLFTAMQYSERLEAMLTNRPRSPSRLTRWISHASDVDLLICPCGSILSLDHAETFPETNRKSLVCPCGLGHYKLLTGGA